MHLPGKLLLAALLALAFAAPQAAFAQSSPGTISGPEALRILRDLDLSPELGRDSAGDPRIVFQMDGLHARMNFFDCRQSRCRSLQLETALDLTPGSSFQFANEYNRKYRYGRIYLDEEMDPYLQFDFELPMARVEEYIISQLETFELLLGHLTSEFDF
ncbi:putative sensory transduction regulator [Luteimonas sp. J16]|jgi:hypothetical protein|uniref:YbjN domain-containing protein n=1 Tax=unclassified Luteimonas TaxID=2629088 RepID=UPI0004BCA2DB|nr:MULTISPECIES: YbjN domain-containing protein [unclassified Luteimonas]TWG89068.1 putative sensory transduction regulator [Luteimonas sp. J16]